jgi:pimeloyl-[acyl-carrier protein] synthase
MEQRSCPTDEFIHSLMNAEINGARLTDDEVIANTIITLIGGHETTTNLIASGFLALVNRPQCFEQLQKHPEIAKSAVEELLRFVSPVQHTARIAPSDMRLGEKTIQKGSKVVAVLAAANRDPARFADPDNLDLRRPDNKHLAFGWGAHFCFGAPLARMEGKIAFNALLRRISNPVLLEKNLEWRTNAGLRGLTMLNISFEPILP